MSEYPEFRAADVMDSLGKTKMVIYRALCHLTHFDYQVDFSTRWTSNSPRRRAAGFTQFTGFTDFIINWRPKTWNVLLPIRLKGIGDDDLCLGVFLAERGEQPHPEGGTYVAYQRVVRIAVVWNEGNVLTYDFDEYGNPLFEFDELGRM